LIFFNTHRLLLLTEKCRSGAAPPFPVSGIEDDMDALDLKQAVSRFARIHADEWKRASKTNAEITNAIVSDGMQEGLTREEALSVAEDALMYMRRYL
jgi:hypothetical protein